MIIDLNFRDVNALLYVYRGFLLILKRLLFVSIIQVRHLYPVVCVLMCHLRWLHSEWYILVCR